jgi:hypothetical protein
VLLFELETKEDIQPEIPLPLVGFVFYFLDYLFLSLSFLLHMYLLCFADTTSVGVMGNRNLSLGNLVKRTHFHSA